MKSRRRSGDGPRPTPPPGFTEFVLGRSASLFRTAVLLTRNRHTAEDLVQSALTKGWRKWDRIEGEPEAYVRRILINEFLSDRARRWSGEHPTEALPEQPVHDRLGGVPADPATVVTDQQTLADAVAALPPRQRAVIVLRYFHDLTEAQTAAAMGTSTGTVKSQHSRALAALRISEQLETEPAHAAPTDRRDLS